MFKLYGWSYPYNVYLRIYDGSEYQYYENIFYAESGLTRQLPAGEYGVLLQSTNSNYWMDDGSDWLNRIGDWVYFTVFDEIEKPVLKPMNTTYHTSDNVTFTWDATANTTHYNVYLRIYDGSEYQYYENIFYAESGLTRQLPAGEYGVLLQSTNSNYWMDDGSDWLNRIGDWVYFTVFDEIEKPVLKPMNTTYHTSENVVFTWDATDNTTHYNAYIDTLIDGEYKRTENMHYVENGLTRTFEAGKYRILLQASNSNYWVNNDWLYTTGDWVYFTVADSNTPYVITDVRKVGNSYNVYNELYNIEDGYTIIVAGYKGGKLVTMQSHSCAQDVLTTPLAGDIDEIKIMVWDSLSGLMPICEAEVIPKSEWIIE